MFFSMKCHSFLPSDRDFRLIKRNLNAIDGLYTPNHYIDMVTNASSKNLDNDPEW